MTDQTTTHAISEKVAALRARFRGRLATRMDALGNAIDALESPIDPHALEGVVDEAHRIRGTAGSYGLASATELAASVEDHFRPLLDSEVPIALDQPLITELRRKVRRMADELGAEPDPVPAARPEPQTQPDPESEGERSRSVRVQPPLLVVGAGQRTDAISALGERLSLPLVFATPAQVGTIRGPLWGALLHVDGAPESAAALTRRLRADVAPHLPIALVGGSSELVRDIGVHAGVTTIVQEPLNETRLREVLSRFETARRTQQPTVLLIDDDPEFALIVSELLAGRELRLVHESDPRRALEAIAEERPDLVLLDLKMEPIDGLEVARRIRALEEWRTLPILFMTAAVSDEVRLACYRAGADDYITKPVLAEELDARIRVRLDRQRLHRERADIDPLTGLANRRAFSERFENLLARARDTGVPVSLCLIDLDHFKRLNDEYGHLAGDQALERLGQLMQHSARFEDLRGRWGGEEFVLALWGLEPAVARRVLQRILSEVRACEMDAGVRLSFTAGVAGFPHDGESLEELLRSADARLYHGKETGRGRVVSEGKAQWQ